MMRQLLWLFFCLPLIAQWEGQATDLTGSSGGLAGAYGHSWADVDQDGDADLFINAFVPKFFLNKVNEGMGFVNATELIPVSFSGSGFGATFGDFNNDGFPDLFVSRSAPGRSGDYFLLENRWPDAFVAVTETMGILDNHFPQSINWVDYNLDGRLDLYVTHEYPGQPHYFYESAYPDPFIERFPPGTGEDTFGLADLNSHAYGLAWADMDLDGDMDAVTSACGSNDGNGIDGEQPHNKFYRNNHPTPGFTDISLASGLLDAAEIMGGSQSYWVMLFDYNGDARPDLSIGNANFGAVDHRLWANTGTGPGDVTLTPVPVETHNMYGPRAYLDGASTGDYDNDGDLDIYTTTEGLYRNNGDGTYTLTSGTVGDANADASFVDFDRDGHLDLYNMSNLYRNPGDSGNHWLAIELEGDPNQGTTRGGYGAKIRVRAGDVNYYREHRFMVGTYSQHMLPTHFGLGVNTLVQEIEITWPGSQQTTLLTNVAADQYITVFEADTVCNSTLRLTEQPVTQFPCAGESVSLTVEAAGTGPFTYQWKKNGDDLPGETNASLSMTMDATKTGDYTCVVSNGICDQTSTVATLTNGVTVAFTSQPDSVFVFAGDNADFSINTDNAPSGYTWQQDGLPLGDTDNATLNLTNVTIANRGLYRCVLSTCQGELTSNEAALCVVAAAFREGADTWPFSGSVLDLAPHITNACPPEEE